MTHTQGPWRATGDSIRSDNHMDGTGALLLAAGPMFHAYEPDPEEQSANLKLAAAAPAMLSALQALLRERALEGGGDPDDFDWVRSADADPAGTWQAAHQAIAKATEEVTA